MKILVVGYGSIGKRHVNNLSSLLTSKILVCTNREYDKFLKKKDCKIFKSLKKSIVEKPKAALITNVTSEHVETAINLANAGINLFIEKPLSNSFSNVKKLIRVVKKKKIVTMIGCNLRFHPCIKKN